jgi:Zn-dependent protease
VLRRGFLTIGRWGGVPIQLHWTLPIGLLLFAGFVPGACVGFILLILLHECGHALLVRRCGLRVGNIAIYGFGGECQYFGQPSPIERSIIAWGGVLAQLCALIAADQTLHHFGQPRARFIRSFINIFEGSNALLIVINLLPIAQLDGREAWLLFPRLWRRLRGRRVTVRRHPLN